MKTLNKTLKEIYDESKDNVVKVVDSHYSLLVMCKVDWFTKIDMLSNQLGKNVSQHEYIDHVHVIVME